MNTSMEAPQGIGTGVGFDWAITIELVVLAGMQLTGLHPFSGHSAASRQNDALIALPLLAVSVLPLLLGEGLRRGYRWAWWVQIVFNSAATLGGLASIPGTLVALRHGNAWPLIPTLVLIGISPLIAWRLTRPATRAWIDRADRAEARRRHGGLWVAQILADAVIGGVLVALSVAYG